MGARRKVLARFSSQALATGAVAVITVLIANSAGLFGDDMQRTIYSAFTRWSGNILIILIALGLTLVVVERFIGRVEAPGRSNRRPGLSPSTQKLMKVIIRVVAAIVMLIVIVHVDSIRYDITNSFFPSRYS